MLKLLHSRLLTDQRLTSPAHSRYLPLGLIELLRETTDPLPNLSVFQLLTSYPVLLHCAFSTPKYFLSDPLCLLRVLLNKPKDPFRYNICYLPTCFCFGLPYNISTHPTMNRPTSTRYTCYSSRSSHARYNHSRSFTDADTRAKMPNSKLKTPRRNAGHHFAHKKPQRINDDKPLVSNENANIQASAGKGQYITALKPPRYPKASPAKERPDILLPPPDQNNYAPARLTKKRGHTRTLNKSIATRPTTNAPRSPRISRQRVRGGKQTLTARGSRSSRLLSSIHQQNPSRFSSESRMSGKPADNACVSDKSDPLRSRNAPSSFPGKHGDKTECVLYKKPFLHSRGVHSRPLPLVRRSQTRRRSVANDKHVSTNSNLELSRRGPLSNAEKSNDLTAFALFPKHPLPCDGFRFPPRRTHHTHATHGNSGRATCAHFSQSPDEGRFLLWEGIKGLFLNATRFLATLDTLIHVER